MSKIEKQFQEWRKHIDFVDGRYLIDPYKEFPEFDLYNKAFKLKRYGRCPQCIAHMKIERNIIELQVNAKCTGCDFKFSISDLDLIKADNLDDPILEIVKQVIHSAR